MEAASVGRALICSDIPGCREAVEDGVNGFLCEKMNVDSLYRCMEYFMELDEETHKNLGRAGRLKMEQEFGKDHVVAETIKAVVNSMPIAV